MSGEPQKLRVVVRKLHVVSTVPDRPGGLVMAEVTLDSKSPETTAFFLRALEEGRQITLTVDA